MSLRKAIFPGSFDPITNGHIDLIVRAARMFDHLTVLVSHKESKTYLFSVQERVQMVADALKQNSKIQVDHFAGLTTQFMKKNEIQFIVRGLRNFSDYEYEIAMANINSKISSDVETVILFSHPDYAYISSGAIKEASSYQTDISAWVPVNVQEALKKKYAEKETRTRL